MITSVFRKANPINFILIIILLILGYFVGQLSHQKNTYFFINFVSDALVISILIFTFFVVNFISKRNNLSKDNTYVFLTYFLLFLLFSDAFNNNGVIISNFFVLLAFRRLLSLRSQIQVKEKIFDASFWIFIASLFHFWCILFILLVFMAIVFHVSSDFRNWTLPIIAFLTVFILSIFFGMQFAPEWLKTFSSNIQISFNFDYFKNKASSAALMIYGFLSLGLLGYFLISLSSKSLNLLSSNKLVVAAYIVAVAVFIISPEKSNALLLYSFFPFAILNTSFLEDYKEYWSKEAYVILFVVVAIIFYIQNL
jgi:hypothetical protein